MKFFSDFIKGVSNCFKAFGVLFERGLWPYMFIPLAIWLLVWILSIYGLIVLADGLSKTFAEYINAENIPVTGHWLSWFRPYIVGKLGFLIGIVLKIVFWFFTGTFVKYLVLIVLSPVFSLLSEHTEEKITGNKFPFSFLQLLKDIFRGILISLRNMILEYFFIFMCFLLTVFFPPMIFITAPFLLLLGWYYVGFTLLDYNCERHKLKASESSQLIRSQMGYAIAIGMVYSFFLALPFFMGSVIGMMFGPAVAVVGGTLSFLEMRRLDTNVDRVS
jgi:CysZ protein